MVVLVPRQLRMTGMTGNVPYYGGRFTPAQAYAVSQHAPPRSQPPSPPPPQPSAAPAPRGPREALDHLLETGIIDQHEHDQLLARLPR